MEKYRRIERRKRLMIKLSQNAWMSGKKNKKKSKKKKFLYEKKEFITIE